MLGPDLSIDSTSVEMGPVFPDFVVCFSHDGTKSTPVKNRPYALSLNPRPIAWVPTDVNP